jgi:hypothetical protein
MTDLAQTPDDDSEAREFDHTASAGVFFVIMRDPQKYSARVDRHSASTETRSWLLLAELPTAATTEEKYILQQALMHPLPIHEA